MVCLSCFFFFKQKTAYEVRISDWSSDVCSADLLADGERRFLRTGQGHGDVSLCRFDGAAPTSGALQIAAVARNAALSEGRCHRPPGGPGEGADPGGGPARNAGGNSWSLDEEDCAKKYICSKPNGPERRIQHSFHYCTASETRTSGK